MYSPVLGIGHKDPSSSYRLHPVIQMTQTHTETYKTKHYKQKNIYWIQRNFNKKLTIHFFTKGIYIITTLPGSPISLLF